MCQGQRDCKGSRVGDGCLGSFGGDLFGGGMKVNGNSKNGDKLIVIIYVRDD